MKMRMANILKDASAAKDLLAVQHGLKRQPGCPPFPHASPLSLENKTSHGRLSFMIVLPYHTCPVLHRSTQ